MALTTEHKLYIGLGIAAVLGVAVYVQSTQKKEERAAYSAEKASAELPKLDLTEEQTKAVTKVEIARPGNKEAANEADKKPLKVVLEKKGEEWSISSPVKAKANDANLKSLLENLEKLTIEDRIASGTDQYEKYDLTDDKAVHAVFYKGGEKLADLYFGKSGGRGQMTRIAGKDGVFAVKGYSSFIYSRDLKGWRDRTIFKFDEKKVKTVDLVNEKGTFAFVKDGESWKGQFAEPEKKLADLEKFDPKKVDDLLRAFKALNADDFGDDKKKADVGLETPLATLTITLDDGAKRILSVGASAAGESRWAMQNGSDLIFSISSWSGNWATAEVAKFQSDKDAKGGDAAAGDGAPEAPPFEMPEME